MLHTTRSAFWKNYSLLSVFLILAVTLPTSLFAVSGAAGFPGVEITIPNETVPPGGMLQLKIQITEPKPIVKGGHKTAFAGKFLGTPQGFALFSPLGDASGTAVLSKGAAQFSFTSPLGDFGQSIDYPLLTIAIPVKQTAITGQNAPLTLNASQWPWLDPNGKPYPVLTKDGLATVGGTLSVSNIVPGGGLVKAGTKIAIFGVGFQPNSKVQIDTANLASQTYVSPKEIDVTLTADTNMTSLRVRIKNPSTNELATYYSYQRTISAGVSTHKLVAATMPLFATTTWALAYFRPVLNAAQFTGLALQNATTAPSSVRLQLYSAPKGGTLLATRNLTIPANTRLTRDLAEFFPVAAATGTSVKVTVITGPQVQLLGLLGNDTMKTVDPVDPSLIP